MEVTGAAAPLASSVQIAVQKHMLDAMKQSGAQLNQLIASAPTPTGSVNLPWQGSNLDARV